ncbi:MAG: hypothetical protein LH475_04915 [Cryobacterium sp.]|uniref:hypothetical protein n=1 Tax=Cryobacterium sp. TaxID=1926290 RepID=UPI00228FB01B|nr:hypothetical protein [Cryobacterium sp.]MCY7403961.1 hypothetical protein [Cryobacterium sp.]
MSVHGYVGYILSVTVTVTVAGLGGPDLPRYRYSPLTIALVGFLGYRHIDVSSTVLGVLLVAEVAIVLAQAAEDPGAMILITTLTYLGPIGEIIMNVLPITSMSACVLSFHSVNTRYQHSMSNAKVLPNVLGSVHHKHVAPYVSSVVQTMTAVVLIVNFAVLGLAGSAVVIAANFPMLVSDVNARGLPVFGTISAVLLGLIMLFPAVGLVQAAVLKRTDRAAYDNMTDAISG